MKKVKKNKETINEFNPINYTTEEKHVSLNSLSSRDQPLSSQTRKALENEKPTPSFSVMQRAKAIENKISKVEVYTTYKISNNEEQLHKSSSQFISEKPVDKFHF